MCPVWIEIAVLLISLAPLEGEPVDVPAAVLFCEVCRLSFPDLPSMQQHLSRAHKLEPNDWIPARDLLVAEAWKTIVQEGTVPAGPYAKTGTDTQVSNMWHEF